MNEISQRLTSLWPLTGESLLQVVDILLVALILYKLISMVRSSRAWRLLIGIIVFVAALIISDMLQLRTLHWILDKATLLAPVALVILFLPELRKTLEGFGKLGEFTERGQTPKDGVMSYATLEEIVAAVAELSSTKTGALIVLERGGDLDDICQTGVPLRAQVTASLLGSIFFDQGPLHDGAAVIRRNEIAAAACRLPLSESPHIASHLHMRHRAGIGLSEQIDAFVIVVSEERGTIGLAQSGVMETFADSNSLRDRLKKTLFPESPSPRRRKSEPAGRNSA
ncbi:MAG: TIGR00159 family protein [Chthonomonas sp.]|nr:TIGR00159 family protein [Chthonomonas sp.]